MTVFYDHPIRLRRTALRLSVQGLADAAGLHRSTLQAIEDGRTRSVDGGTVEALAPVLRMSEGALWAALVAWGVANSDPRGRLLPSSVSVLAFEPASVSMMFSTFAQWRASLAPSVTALSSALGVNRRLIADYERGAKVRGMPLSLGHAIKVGLQVSDEYLVAVQGLPTGRVI